MIPGAIVKMEQGFFPCRIAGNLLNIIDTDQVHRDESVQAGRIECNDLAHREIDGFTTMLFNSVQGGKQEMSFPAGVTPEIERIGRAGVTENLDGSQGFRIPAVDEIRESPLSLAREPERELTQHQLSMLAHRAYMAAENIRLRAMTDSIQPKSEFVVKASTLP